MQAVKKAIKAMISYTSQLKKQSLSLFSARQLKIMESQLKQILTGLDNLSLISRECYESLDCDLLKLNVSDIILLYYVNPTPCKVELLCVGKHTLKLWYNKPVTLEVLTVVQRLTDKMGQSIEFEVVKGEKSV